RANAGRAPLSVSSLRDRNSSALAEGARLPSRTAQARARIEPRPREGPGKDSAIQAQGTVRGTSGTSRTDSFAIAELVLQPIRSVGPPSGLLPLSHFLLRYDPFDDLPFHIGQTCLTSGVTIAQFLVIQSQQVKDGRVPIVDVDLVVNRLITVVVCLAIGQTALNAAPGHPHRVTGMIVVA